MEYLWEICVGILLIYALLGWVPLTGLKINYGRLQASISKVNVNPRLAWFLFEIPNLIWAIHFLIFEKDPLSIAYLIFIIHYVNRTIIYPLRMKSNTGVPLQIIISAFGFTSANGYLQGFANKEAITHSQIRTFFGLAVFVIGFAINIWADSVLQAARNQCNKQKIDQKNPKRKYIKIDTFLFKYISNPNYFGQVIEWAGYCIVSDSVEAYLFLFLTLNVLTPAAILRNRWNKLNIPDYPKDRRAILPFII